MSITIPTTELLYLLISLIISNFIFLYCSKDNFNLEYVEEADYGLNYILSNGYPNKNIVDNNYIDYSITQYAILLYLMDEGYINNGKDDMDDNSEDNLNQDYDEFLKGYESLANQPEYAEFYNKINELYNKFKIYL